MVLLRLIKNLLRCIIQIKPRSNTLFMNKTSFREATIFDQNYIFNSILREAKARHFNEAYLDQKFHESIRHQILSTIKNQIIPISCDTHKTAILYVLTHENKPIGFSWVRSFDIEQKNEWEIYLMAVDPFFRNQQFGYTLFDATIKTIKASNIYVTVYKQPSNKAMMKLLKYNNFQKIKTNARDSYKYKRSSVVKMGKTGLL